MLRSLLRRFAVWLGRVGCRWQHHPLKINHRRFIAGETGDVSAREEWQTCECGDRAGPLVRIRTIQPYPEARR